METNELLEEYSSMSRDELIDMLGNENAELLRKGLDENTFSARSLYDLIHKAIQDSIQADAVFDALLLKLSEAEVYCLYDDNPSRKELFKKFEGIRNRIEKQGRKGYT